MQEERNEPKPGLIKRYNNWVIGWSKKKNSEQALAGFAFAESSFFPIPIDPLLITLIINQPKKTWRLVNISTVFSVLGGLLGYVVGFFLMKSLGQWLIDTYNLQAGFDSLGKSYQDNAFLAVTTAALTPIPFKIITISAGAFKISLTSFITASIFGRYLRYGLVGWASRFIGNRYPHKLEMLINLLSVGVLGLIVLVVAVAQFA